MSDEIITPLPPIPPLEKNENEPLLKPQIRTMKSDIETLLKKAPPPSIQIIQPAPQGQAPLSHLSALQPKTLVKPRIRIGRIIFFIGIAAVAGVFAYSPSRTFLLSPFHLLISTTKTPPPVAVPSPEMPSPPRPFFATETAHTLIADTAERAEFIERINKAVHEDQREGTITRLIIRLKDGPNERFATVDDLFSLYRIEPPEGFFTYLDPNIMPFLYHAATSSFFGFAFTTRDLPRTFRGLLDWEKTLPSYFAPLLFDQSISIRTALFEDRTYRNIDWRYLILDQKKAIGIGYALFPASNVVVVTTSEKAMETVINRLFDAR